MKRALFVILAFILIVLLSGCLPKVPDKIAGPTWVSKYQNIPLFQRTQANGGAIYFNKKDQPAEGSKEINLGLKNPALSFLL